MTKQIDLMALVGSRICHDLISPLGAIGNGLELMELSGGEKTPEFSLIEESVKNANARIKFFRIAYGAAAADQFLSEADIVTTVRVIGEGARVSYQWDVEGAQSKQDVRIAFLLFQCFETAMPFGGEIIVTKTGDHFTATASAERLKIDEALWQSLQNPQDATSVSPSQVQFALLPALLEQSGRSLDLSITGTSISASF